MLFGTFLSSVVATGFGNLYTGSTNNPTLAASWAWWIIGGIAQTTNQAAGTLNLSDQPWLLRNRGTARERVRQQ